MCKANKSNLTFKYVLATITKTYKGLYAIMSNAALFTPFKLGTLELKNRVVMAPMTRTAITRQYNPMI